MDRFLTKYLLLDSAQSGDLMTVEKCLSLGADPNVQDFNGYTPLHYTSKNGHEKIVEQLLKAGASHSAVDEQRYTPLHYASKNGHEKIVDQLLKAGANHSAVNNATIATSRNKNGYTLLHYASKNGHEKIVEQLLKAGASHSTVNYNEYTSLHYASMKGHEKIVEQLLNAGANHSAVDEWKCTPLHYASMNGHEKIVEQLLKASASHSAVNKEGYTPLHYASKNGHEKIVDQLLKAGASHLAFNYNGYTPLHYAFENGHEKIIELLLKADASHSAVNYATIATSRNKNGYTLLHYASKNEHEKIVEQLLKAGASHSAVDNEGYTALHYASINGHEKIVEQLLKAGASHSAVDENGYTPLHYASMNGHEKIVEQLLKAGANHSAVNDYNGDTPLHCSASFGHKQVMEILIRHGADINARNKKGFLYGQTSLELLKDKSSRSSLRSLAVSEAKKKEATLKLFLKECQDNGTIDMLPIKCVLTGLPGVGKTSFLRRIQKKLSSADALEQVIPSTGFEASLTVNVCEETTTASSATVQCGQWVPTDNLYDQAKFLLCSIKHTTPMKTSSKAGIPSKPNQSQSFKKENIDVLQCTASLISQSIPLPISAVDVTKDLPLATKKSSKKLTVKNFIPANEIMQKAADRQILKQHEEIDRLTTVYFLDTGGQPEFHELLPPLLHGSAFHLIFFNAFFDLYKAINVIYRHKDAGMHSIEYETNSSSIEIIHQLLVSFFSISTCSNQEHQSVAALFGSYVDQFSTINDEHKKELRKVSDSLKQAFDNAEFFKHGFLQLPSSEDCPYIFQPIDNITCSEAELDRVQNFLYQVIQKQFSAVSLPVKWGAFHLTLRHKYEKSPGLCSMDECISVAEECEIPVEHVSHVLSFFHFKLGTILHYEEIESLKHFIIVNPNTVFHGISQLVTMSFMGSGEHCNAASTVRRTGEISKTFIQLNKPLSAGSPLTNQHIVDLLVHFKLMHVTSRSVYRMPCLLLPDPTVVSSLVSLDVLDISPPPLLILFEEGFVPIGLFSGIVNELSKEWDLDEENRFRNRVTFITHPGSVELRHCLKYIEVRPINMVSFCKQIPDKMLKCLQVISEIQPHLQETKYSIGFYCPGSLSSYLHPCKYNDSFAKSLVCSKAPKCFKSKRLPPQHIPWFESTEVPPRHNSPVPYSVEEQQKLHHIDITNVDNSLLEKDDLLESLKECYEVIDWMILGLALGICEAELKRIQEDERLALRCQKAMLSKWIDSGKASWRGLVNGLLCPPLKAEEVAKSVAENHPLTDKNKTM